MCIKNICFCHHHNNSSTNNMMSVMLKRHPHKYNSVTVVHLCVWTTFIILSSSELTVDSVDLLPKTSRVRVMALYIYCPDSIIYLHPLNLFSSVQDDISSLGKTHTRSTPPLRNVRSVAFQWWSDWHCRRLSVEIIYHYTPKRSVA